MHLKTPSLSTSRPLPCAHMDWYEIGRLDGLSGTPLSKLEEHKLQCPDGPGAVHEEMYTNGRDAGLVDYCSVQGGLEAGKNGEEYKNVCPAHLEPVFLANFRLGQKIRELESENEDLDARIRNLSRLISPTSPSPSIRSQIDQLRSRRTQNNIRIIDLENQAGTTGQL